ncbi:hypothetical protein SPSF3K_00076 [Streptococcus parauberis]|uniref:DUF4352 domain-containing protein n=1 Tax=Streptococcus parauberis KRS-02083 TaxID=1207545 RepID=A0ABN0IP16_9STRE|nr:hypothetical protein [Streptococcus parauberis]QBX09815.1 hypothetical protein JavanS390_0004 [Streptococcus satellite phage Javan390]QBX09859.1 hypothetical protein JavanS395_0004 [Streptococcus satellite phage Javan395]AUT04818.1 hypothetical protein SPSF3K_00076 [Streptococcus parauberis]EMG24566.1 hypothetical protein SPJ1_2087 [Streptococcus parauberis KRS-02083]UWV10290.1 hypothetical protein N2A95_00370 [Streptococcus parauberis]
MKLNSSLVISIISLIISIYVFISKHYRELYRLGVYNSDAIFDHNSNILFVKIVLINESSLPITIENLSLFPPDSTNQSSNRGMLINESINVVESYDLQTEVYEYKTLTMPTVVPPYSKVDGFYAFSDFLVYGDNYILEVELPNKLLHFNFYPNKKYLKIFIDKENESRLHMVTWRQHPLREKVYFVSKHLKIRTWQTYKIRSKIWINNSISKVKQSIRKK